MRTRTDEHEDEHEIPLSPMIDAVFLLLIFFLVSTMMKQVNRDIDIQLPESASAERIPARDDNRVIGINADGDVFYEGEPTTVQQLHNEIRFLGMESPDMLIRLDVDQDTPTHRVIEVLNLCQFNNLNSVGIRTYDEYYNRQ